MMYFISAGRFPDRKQKYCLGTEQGSSHMLFFLFALKRAEKCSDKMLCLVYELIDHLSALQFGIYARFMDQILQLLLVLTRGLLKLSGH